MNYHSQPTPLMQDSFGRQFSYLRLSITDICNFRCSYCLPFGYQKSCSNNFLSVDEIKNLVSGFTEIGISKIRLTGGEPAVRKDFANIINTISSIPKVKNIAFTTNGYNLKKYAIEWFEAGASAVNISVNSPS